MSTGGLIVLMFTAVVASVISSVFGLAGGAILFTVLTWVVSIKEAIPIHSGVQLIGNTSRVLVYIREVRWDIVWRFVLLLVPGAYLGGLFFGYFHPLLLEFLVGAFILATVLIPKPKHQSIHLNVFIGVGFVSSFFGMIVAVTGPFIASFFVFNNVTKEAMVGTKSVCQALTQLSKIIVFSSVMKFDFTSFAFALFLLGFMAVVGTFIGKKIIGKISDKKYNHFNNLLLGGIALSMMLKVILTLVL
ncbi:sulfite exporter TauE/SafE family protein [Microscilla marina]|uniref:Probable membrane transporter protein n=1 Tax=Microscilla marina ATCC 23134 TaxID=313606 RepID=A1ZSR9_MICM2|nr:sulfite exporter TauE/SafE family protein [Microscilla marina]EAY26649.1 domain of unknown function, putative [Microscilla marina ATCC 23134]